MAKDYIYAVTPLLEDALMDRDAVHRQTAASALKHMGAQSRRPSVISTHEFSCVH
jgi:HEAT repeat protein